MSARAALIGASAIYLFGASAPAHAAPGDSDQGLFYRLGVGIGYGSLGADAALVDDQAPTLTGSLALGAKVSRTAALHATFAGSFFIDDHPFGHNETSFATLGLGVTLWPGPFEAAGVYLSLSLGFAFSLWDSDPDGAPSHTIGFGGEIVIGKDWVVADALRVGLGLEGVAGSGPGEYVDTQTHYGLAVVFVLSGR
ncbi:MAG: hypothetical protein JNJ59_18600 [Deltaproteobacteria bacterium]|nr:hypothetical protein [Deltaproteobacteria bacterium]